MSIFSELIHVIYGAGYRNRTGACNLEGYRTDHYTNPAWKL